MIPLSLPSHAVPDRYSVASKHGAVAPHSRRTFANLDGPGCIRHIWLVVGRQENINRKGILRIYFDGSEVPHVEAPIGDFFGVMHGAKWYPVNTALLSVKAETGYNCYFAMPFSESARIEIESGDATLKIYMIIDWHRYPGQRMLETRRFCARWRRECLTERYTRDFLVMDADGPGDLVGFVYGVRLYDDTDRWSHGGADNIYGDGGSPSCFYLRGIGGEDTFGTSFGGALHPPETHLFAGMPYYAHEDVGEARPAQRVVGYRFFQPDGIHFEKSLHFRFGCMANDICATSYWYQEDAPRPFFRLQGFSELMPSAPLPRGQWDLDLPATGQWWLCGPFPYGDGPAFLEDIENIETGVFNSGETIQVVHDAASHYLGDRAKTLGRDSARWVPAEAHRAFIDFNHYFRCAARGVVVVQPALAVARCALRTERACSATLTLSWDDHALIRINDQAPMDLGTQEYFRTRIIEIPLQQGVNRIAIKLSNTAGTNHGGWAFAFSCITDDGVLLIPEREDGARSVKPSA